MKTPEEIKKGLETCVSEDNSCDDCPYAMEFRKDLYVCYGTKRAVMADALAYIQQIEAHGPRWISLEERLPKEFATVIIWRNDCKNATIGWLIGGHWSVPKGVRVTHWMPMPEPPEEDAHD